VPRSRSTPTVVPPHSVEAEQAIIGGLMLDNTAIHQCGQLRDADFWRADHRRIYRAITALAAEGRPFDVVTVAEAIEAGGDLDRIGGLPYIAALAENTPSAANVAAYADIVRERARQRHALKRIEDARERLIAPNGHAVDGIIADALAGLEGLLHASTQDDLHVSQLIDMAMTEAKRAADARRAGTMQGISTGIDDIDLRTGGIHGKRLWILAGRPGVGKSALKLQIAIRAALQGRAVGVISLEMGDAELGFRALAATLCISGTRLASGDADTFERLKSSLGSSDLAALRKAPLWFNFTAGSLAEVIAQITAWRRQHGIELAVVDHIGLVDAQGFATRNDQLGAISRGLKKLAMRLDMPILVLSQLNRAVEREGRRPNLADLRDSGNLEQDADVVIMLHALNEDGTEIEVGIMKNRSGPRGPLGSLRFDGRTQRFTQVAAPSNP